MKKRGDEKPLGKHWIESFKSRHEDIYTKISRLQEAVRFNCFTPKAVY